MPAALLIGAITHSMPEWNDLSSILTLKEFPSGTREDFIRNCRDGQYDDVVAIYRSNTSTKVSGTHTSPRTKLSPCLSSPAHSTQNYSPSCPPHSSTSPTMAQVTITSTSRPARRKVHQALPPALSPLTISGIAVSSTPVAVNNATADVAIFLMIGALRQAYIPVTSLREGEPIHLNPVTTQYNHETGKFLGQTGLGHDPQNKVLGILGMGGIGRVSLAP